MPTPTASPAPGRRQPERPEALCAHRPPPPVPRVVSFWYPEGGPFRAMLLYVITLAASMLASHCAAGGGL